LKNSIVHHQSPVWIITQAQNRTFNTHFLKILLYLSQTTVSKMTRVMMSNKKEFKFTRVKSNKKSYLKERNKKCLCLTIRDNRIY
jgi:hypothetical protein